MDNLTKIALLSSFFGIWLSNFFNFESQIIVGFFLILFFGIIHGSNDIMLINNFDVSKKSNLTTIIIQYIISIAFFSGIFIFFPIVGLFIFVVLSSYHFGEQQFKKIFYYKNIFLMQLHRTIYGLLLFFMLFVNHTEEVIKIVQEISNITITESFITYSCLVLSIVMFFMFLYCYIKTRNDNNSIVLNVFLLGVFFILFKISSLIWGFTIYFIFWHSIPSIFDQVNYLYKSISLSSFIKYVKSALPYWVASITGLFIFYNFFNDSKLFNSIFFSFIAALTFPHVFVIGKIYSKK